MTQTVSNTPELTTATAVVWHGTDAAGHPELTEQSFPLIAGPEDAVVEIDWATVCGSDRHTASGRRSAPRPSVLGHEAVGRIVQVRTGRRTIDGRSLAVGDRVVWTVTDTCVGPELCDRCQAGMTAKCRRVRKTGHESTDSDWPLSGGYASHIVLPPGVGIALVPDDVSDAAAATAACALATVTAGVEAVTTVRSMAGARVAIFGAGMLGFYSAALAATAGAGEIVVLDPNAQRRELARDFGATRVAADADGLTVDVVFELSGAPQAVVAGLAALDIGGALLLAGSVTPTDSVALDPERVVRNWLTIRGVHNYEPRHLVQAITFLAETTWPWEQVIGDPVALTELPRLLAPDHAGTPGLLRESVRHLA